MKTHEFYPMITSTVKSIVKLSEADTDSVFMIMLVLCSYPNQEDFLTEEEKKRPRPPLYYALVDELDRQYARWNKGGNNGK